MSVALIAVIVYFLTRPVPGQGPVSIVLLPLENITEDKGQEWFTDGMTDALITNLARISGLRVTQRSSAMKYRGANKSASRSPLNSECRTFWKGRCSDCEPCKDHDPAY